MTYATQQLTQALQELTALHSSRQQDTPAKAAPSVVPAQQLQFSTEVEQYLAQRQAYTQKTRDVSVGTY